MPALMLRRLAVAVLLGALVVAFGTLDTRPAWTIGRTLVPLVFAVTIALEWAVDHDTDEGILSIVFGKLESIWDSGGAGFYGAVAAATFLRLEALTLIGEWNEAGSASAFFRSELAETVVGFSLESIMNTVAAGIWFVGWLDLPSIEALGLGAACFGAYGLGRWAWPDEGRADTLETAIERLTDPGRSS